ncbi:MAG: MarR family transcriptional regulator [Ignavibacteria bacterium]|nr:MarR family transcriptional regulator [Ignavibacteria bacterium]
MKIIEALSILKNNCANHLDKIRIRMKLSPAEFNGIISIRTNEKLTCNELSRKMGLSPSRGSRVINKLIQKGYLKEERNVKDKRCNIITLSQKGSNVKKKIEDLINECESEIQSKLSESEIESISISLEKLIKVL